jgi:hypothetical protein
VLLLPATLPFTIVRFPMAEFPWLEALPVPIPDPP